MWPSAGRACAPRRAGTCAGPDRGACAAVSSRHAEMGKAAGPFGPTAFRAHQLLRAAARYVVDEPPAGIGVGCQPGGCGPPRVGTSDGYTSLPWIA
jgi:hypothetical protein